VIAFDVPGVAVTQGSHRIGWTKRGRAVVVPDQGSARLREYRSRVRQAARAALWNDRGAFPMAGPVRLEVVFERRFPKRLRSAHPATRPDLDKLARAVLDALSGVLYRDDGQVVELVLSKLWATDPRTVIRFEPLG